MIEALGINFFSLLTQIINFLIMLFFLSKILYKPILKTLEERRKKIEEGLRFTERKKEEEKKWEEEKRKIISQANKEARRLLEEEKKSAEKLKKEIIAEAQRKAREIIERSKKDIEERKARMEKEVIGKTVEIAAAMVEKIIGEVLEEKQQRAIIKKRLNQLAHFKSLEK